MYKQNMALPYGYAPMTVSYQSQPYYAPQFSPQQQQPMQMLSSPQAMLSPSMQQQVVSASPQFSRPSKVPKTWLERNWKLLLAGLIIVLGIACLVIAAVEYSQYHKLTDKTTVDAKNKKEFALIILGVGAVLLIVGSVLAFFSRS